MIALQMDPKKEEKKNGNYPVKDTCTLLGLFTSLSCQFSPFMATDYLSFWKWHGGTNMMFQCNQFKNMII